MHSRSRALPGYWEHALTGEVCPRSQINVDTPLSYEQMQTPELTYAVVQPLTVKYAAWKNHSAGQAFSSSHRIHPPPDP